MSTIYQTANAETRSLVNEVLTSSDFHQPLLDAKVKIDLLMAFAETDDKGELIGCALKKHGHRALGLARIIPLDQRVKGAGDAEIKLDGDWWKDADGVARMALLDHELTHLAVSQSRTGMVRTDDLGRPKLKLRLHDVEAGWFVRCAKRWGGASIEVTQAKRVYDAHGQVLFPFVTLPDVPH